jgi:hypothetical protein
MKKKIMTVALLLSCSFIIAQTEFDALKYVQTDINGTARYMSMAGAFGALGGDASSIKDNPAGLGIYRKSELTGSLNIMMQNSTSNWQYKDGPVMKNSFGYDDIYKIGPNNISLVLASPTWRNENGSEGLLSSNWSFSYNRLKNFDRNTNIKSGASISSMTDYLSYFSEGYYPSDFYYPGNQINYLFDNPNLATLSIYGYQGFLMDSVSPGIWQSGITNMVTPAYKLSEKGHLDEYSVGWAGNFSNMLYFGATLNYQVLNYTSVGKYSESFGSEGYMSLGDTVYSKGSGVNLNLGAIIRPTDFLRFGISLHTPTVFAITDQYYSTLVYDRLDNSGVNRISNGTIVGSGVTKTFQLQNPLQINASAAFIIGNKGLISAEYVLSNYTGTKFLSDNGNSQEYSYENDGMKQLLNDVRTIKIGGEYKLTENISLRAGYANTNNGTKPDAEKLLSLTTKRVDTEYFLQNSTNYLTAGFGYREANWFIDFAYMNKVVDETFYPYRSSVLTYKANPATVSTATNNVVVTLGFKF